MTLQVRNLGFGTAISANQSKIAFKGKDFSSGVGSSGKGQSSSSSERTERPRRTETTNPVRQSESAAEKTVKKAAKGASEVAADVVKLKSQLLEMLDKYSKNAEMKKIILEQLRKLG